MADTSPDTSSAAPSYDELRQWLLDAEAHIGVLERELAAAREGLAAARHCVSGGYVRKGPDMRFASKAVAPPSL